MDGGACMCDCMHDSIVYIYVPHGCTDAHVIVYVWGRGGIGACVYVWGWVGIGVCVRACGGGEGRICV